MREGPSIVPAAADDYYMVINHYGRLVPHLRRPIVAAPTMQPPLPI